MTFTAHDIILPDGTHTLPQGPLIAEGTQCLTALQLLAGCGDVRTVADLGALECGYAVAFARAGFEVLAVEARTMNMAKCRYVAGAVNLPNLRLMQGDARDLAASSFVFDAVYCSGLLYHLDQPVAFLAMLGQVTRRLLIVQTHWSGSCHEENEGYRGHWYADAPGEDNPWGSWGNHRSFWLGHDEIIRAMTAAGFSDARPVDDGTCVPERGMFTGVKP